MCVGKKIESQARGGEMNLDPRTRFKVAALHLQIAALKYRAFSLREPGSRAGVFRKRRLLACTAASIRMTAVEARRARREADERCAAQPDAGWLDAKKLLG
jgi:hypothetical protein